MTKNKPVVTTIFNGFILFFKQASKSDYHPLDNSILDHGDAVCIINWIFEGIFDYYLVTKSWNAVFADGVVEICHGKKKNTFLKETTAKCFA